MIRSLKALGLLTVAALAISAMAASSAQATNGIFTSGLTPGTHTGAHFHAVQIGSITENYLETTGEQKISCENSGVMLTGKTTGTDKELTVTPEYSECGNTSTNEKGEHIINKLLTITMEGCDLKFKQSTKLEPNTYTGKVDLSCPTEMGPTFHQYLDKGHLTPICTIEIEPNQTGLEHVVYHNKDNGLQPDHITATVTIEKIKYVTRNKCPHEGETREDFQYFGNYTITSLKTGISETTTEPAEDDLWISDEE